MEYKFIIFSPSYSENNGGAITLHHLCDLIIQCGYECYLYPGFDNHELNILNYKEVLPKFFSKLIRHPLRRFKTSKRFTSKILKKFPGKFDLSDLIVIYPEVVFGNPLGAKNVVRWFLHNPGFFSGKIYYGQNEIYFKYSDQYQSLEYLNSYTSNNNLFIFAYLKDYYNDLNCAKIRNGVAYCVRKGSISTVPFNLKEAILIDGMKHKEISQIFKKVKYFLSFDHNTAFSRFAALCGCISIVVPIDGVDEEAWQPNLKLRYGIAYGFDCKNINKALSTLEYLKLQIQEDETNSKINVKNFINEVISHFNLINRSY